MIRKQRSLSLNKLERDYMRRACQFNAEVLDHVRPHIKEGITTGEIDQIVHEYTVRHGHTPACLGYPGEKDPFPNSCCTSVNEVICHGIPDNYALKSGDIVNVDLTTVVDGWYGDQSETFLIGEVSEEARQVTQCAFDSLYLAIKAIEPDCPVSRIGTVIVQEAAKYGFGVVDKYVGHGIGRHFHQRPNIPHVPTREGQRQKLSPGMCFTIEPMINQGTADASPTESDGWTVRTADRKLSAQFEHTILMTETGPEILTTTGLGPSPGHKF
ncbi:MAG: type I methionyl aminopeptidase [Planctomycetota bacterium]|nr:type I methionyl aminopeptidase [Planctomycetota bacterium]